MKHQGWHWMAFGYVISGPNIFKLVSKDEIEPTIENAYKGTSYDSDDYTATAVYTRAYRGEIADLKPDPWTLENQHDETQRP